MVMHEIPVFDTIHNAGIPEHFQVLRYCGFRYFQSSGKTTDTDIFLEQHVNYPKSRRIRQQSQHFK